eukprot:1146819-Pelagomonas_calceolata.AAC.3
MTANKKDPAHLTTLGPAGKSMAELTNKSESSKRREQNLTQTGLQRPRERKRWCPLLPEQQ